MPDLTVAWLIGVARHKLVDHWRREAREERSLRSLPDEPIVDDDVDERFERARAHEVLDELGAHHRAALTLRYLDGLSVPEVADASRPHRARDRGPARARAQRVPSRLRAR